MSAGDVRLLLADAKACKQGGGVARLLHGRHVAVVAEQPDSASARVFARAAAALGATVVRLRPAVARLADPRSARDTAQMLGRLYSALECDGVSPVTAVQLAGWAGIPVFGALDRDTHPTRLLADLLTISELARKPLAETTLCVAGDAQSPLATAWRHLGAVTGFRVCTCGKHSFEHDSDFISDPQAAPDTDKHAALLAVDRNSRELRPLRTQQAENHRFLVQALLSNSLL